MGGVRARWLWQNFAQLSGTDIGVTSEELAFPQEWMLDSLRSKRWRSKTGWNIFEGINDKIETNDASAGDKTKTLTPGNYALGGDLAAEITFQLNAGPGGGSPIWTCTYNVLTHTFIIEATGVFSLLWSSGANSTLNVGPDIGFDISADDTGASTYLANTLSYQSRQFVQLQFSQPFEVRAGILLDTNITSGGSVRLQGNDANIWTAPIFTTQLTEGDDLWADQFDPPQVLQHWRFTVDDVQNTNGFIEIGVVYIGSYTEPERGYSTPYGENRDELSSIQEADQGAHFQNIRPTRREWSIGWPGLSTADKIEFEKIANHVQAGRPFFFALDADDIVNLVYVSLDSGMGFDSGTNQNWSANFDLLETLG